MKNLKTRKLKSGRTFYFTTEETKRGTELTQWIFLELLGTWDKNGIRLLSEGESTESFLNNLGG